MISSHTSLTDLSAAESEFRPPHDGERRFLYLFFRRIREMNRRFLLQSDFADLLVEVGKTESRPEDSSRCAVLGKVMSGSFRDPWLLVEIRNSIGRWSFGRFHLDDLSFEKISARAFLEFNECLVHDTDDVSHPPIEFDIGAFEKDVPLMTDRRQIGRGVEYLNRVLSHQLFASADERVRTLLEFLNLHHHRGQQLMVSDWIRQPEELRHALAAADAYLADMPDDTPWETVRGPLNGFGLEVGWGNAVGRIRDTLGLLSEIIHAPDPKDVEEFLSRVPMMFSVVILSPHGYFGQSNVLGLPDTGGQVVYILDQVRALEREMREKLSQQGLDTEPDILVVTRLIPEAGDTGCDVAEERINGTRSARILRVPFTEKNGEIVPRWMSRFQIWPYLERFALDAEKTILAEIGGRPDLVLGNYSDGNLVASLLAERLRVIQCNIAHALEKTKYLFSDLYWHESDADYHFSAHFTADLLAMNSADFIITSTYQEIAGNSTSVGQYESYSAFTMPGLYRVPKGIDVFDPKFNIVSPGADEDVYFPHTKTEERIPALADDIERLLHGDFPGAVSHFDDPGKPMLFLMSRLDKVKNVTGFVEWYARNERLRERANVFVIAGNTRYEDSSDTEEKEQIGRFHDLIEAHGLQGRLRWVPKQSDKIFNGELYRTIADRRGVFVQPALFEAFGLTVIEAMISGLPTFATVFGGPMEIIEEGKSGFHIDPNHGEAAAEKMADFFERCGREPGHWEAISRGGIRRVEERYTWRRYASRLVTLTKVYGFWKFCTDLDRAGTRAYNHLFYRSVYRSIVERMTGR